MWNQQQNPGIPLPLQKQQECTATTKRVVSKLWAVMPLRHTLLLVTSDRLLQRVKGASSAEITLKESEQLSHIPACDTDSTTHQPTPLGKWCPTHLELGLDQGTSAHKHSRGKKSTAGATNRLWRAKEQRVGRTLPGKAQPLWEWELAAAVQDRELILY